MLKKMTCAVIGAGMMIVGSTSLGLAADYTHELTDSDMTFAWKVDGDQLAVKMSAKTEGWVGVGFNATDKMQDADFILGYVKDGKAKISDEFGNSKTGHREDDKLGGTESATLVGGSEEGGVTTIEFTIPLKSGDKYDSEIVPEGDTVVLLGYGAGRDSFKSKHTYRATFKVNLATGASSKQ